MKHIVEAKAKINITLDILRRRQDGYHDMRMILSEVDLKDTITIRTETGKPDYVTNSLHFLPTDARNLAYRAALNFFKEAGIDSGGIRLDINKKIPVAAGLAGGSADAAAVLKALSALYPGALSNEQLLELAGRIGSDVSFCMVGGTMLVEGRGEILVPLPPIPACSIVICKPPASISTRSMFSIINCARIKMRPDTEGVLVALERGDLGNIARRMYNVFEDFLIAGRSDVNHVKSILLDEGALGAVMSGSGSSVFGMFDDDLAARRAERRLLSNYNTVFRI